MYLRVSTWVFVCARVRVRAVWLRVCAGLNVRLNADG